MMMRFRDPNWPLIVLFLGIITAVPLIQTLREVRQDEGIRAFEVFSGFPTAANLRVYEKDMEKANWAARLSRPWFQFAQFGWLKDGGEKVVIGSAQWYFYKPGLKYMLARSEPAQSAKGTNDPVAAIVDFRDQLAARGVRLLVMPVPNKDSIYPDRLTSRAGTLRGLLAPRTREVLERLRAAHIEVVDLFKEFGLARQQSASIPQAPLYLAQDTHWSPSGVALAARVVARRLTALGWVGAGHIDYTERDAPVQRLGDIPRMMQAPMIERSLKPESVSSVQVVRCDDGRLYKDGADAEILVLGDSFMRIYQQDEPNAAGFIAHLAKELKRPMMSLVNDGGGSTLVREELCARPVFLKNKKVVLWEFVERDIGIGLKGWQRTQLPAASLNSPAPVDQSGGRAGPGTPRSLAGSTHNG
jgi:hypothetical protein